MKKPFAIILAIVAALCGCSRQQQPMAAQVHPIQKWEYKTLELRNATHDELNKTFSTLPNSAGREHDDARQKLNDLRATHCNFELPDLDKLGMDGWELVGVYTETETSFARMVNETADAIPQDPHDRIAVGANTRTGNVTFVFKRPIQ